jgi:hypothetical protein
MPTNAGNDKIEAIYATGIVLPDGYQEVRYLESSRTQYINTGVVSPTGNHKTLVDIEMPTASNSGTTLFGTRESGTQRWGNPYFATATSTQIYVGGTTGILSQPWVPNVRTKFSLEADNVKKTVTTSYNGAERPSPYSGTTATTVPLYLFGCYNNGIMERGTFRLYGSKIWIDGILVRDFVPALDGAEKPCLFDLVSGTPFYNSGTGEFLHGEVIPAIRKIKEVYKGDTLVFSSKIPAGSASWNTAGTYTWVVPRRGLYGFEIAGAGGQTVTANKQTANGGRGELITLNGNQRYLLKKGTVVTINVGAVAQPSSIEVPLPISNYPHLTGATVKTTANQGQNGSVTTSGSSGGGGGLVIGVSPTAKHGANAGNGQGGAANQQGWVKITWGDS